MKESTNLCSSSSRARSSSNTSLGYAQSKASEKSNGKRKAEEPSHDTPNSDLYSNNGRNQRPRKESELSSILPASSYKVTGYRGLNQRNIPQESEVIRSVGREPLPKFKIKLTGCGNSIHPVSQSSKPMARRTPIASSSNSRLDYSNKFHSNYPPTPISSPIKPNSTLNSIPMNSNPPMLFIEQPDGTRSYFIALKTFENKKSREIGIQTMNEIEQQTMKQVPEVDEDEDSDVEGQFADAIEELLVIPKIRIDMSLPLVSHEKVVAAEKAIEDTPAEMVSIDMDLPPQESSNSDDPNDFFEDDSNDDDTIIIGEIKKVKVTIPEVIACKLEPIENDVVMRAPVVEEKVELVQEDSKGSLQAFVADDDESEFEEDQW